MNSRPVVSMLLSGLLVVLAGCGGGSSSPSKSALAQGEATTNAILSGATPTNSTNLNNALQSFNTAHAQSPTDTQASFGFAVLLLATRVQAIADNYKVSQPDTTNISNVLGRAVMWNTNASSSFNAGNLATGLLAAPSLTRDITASQLPALMNDLESSLNIATPLVDQVGNDPAFTFAFVDNKGPIVVDQADVKTFVAGLYITSALVQFIQAYNYDWGTFPFQASIANTFPGSTILTPDMYMPPAPFVTLQPDGAARFKIIQTDLSTGLSKALLALDALAARTDTTRHVINVSKLDIPTIRKDIAQLQNALTQPQTITITGIPTGVTLNLNAWFTNPPKDLHKFEPTYTLVGMDQDNQAFTTTVASYPDKTFGGLLTGLPDANYIRGVEKNGRVGQLADFIIGIR